ncbi:MAG TPA: hypothetical protein VGF97_15660 [Rhizomicrobium sp.]|jgi:hypothetical protein
MGTAPVPVLVSATATGNALDGKITRSPIDDLFAQMSSHLLIYLRASKIDPSKSQIVDALGNAITASTSGVTKNVADTNFSGHESITLNNSTNTYTTQSGGIGIGSPPVAMSNSFSIVAGLRSPNSFSGTSSCIYGDGTSSNGGCALYVGTSGNLNASINGTVELSVSSALATATTYAFWYSYDASTKTHRYGLNSPNSLAQTTGSQSRTSQGTSTICYPFGFYSSGTCGFWSFNRWAIFNKAYMNGAIPADDMAFSNLISAYAAYI